LATTGDKGMVFEKREVDEHVFVVQAFKSSYSEPLILSTATRGKIILHKLFLIISI
jgi:hypothetical protein